MIVYEFIVLCLSLLLQLVSCEVSNDRLWMSIEDNCSISFVSDSAMTHIIHCSDKGNLTVLDCFCVTYNEEESLMEVGNCIYNCENIMKSDLSDYFIPCTSKKCF